MWSQIEDEIEVGYGRLRRAHLSIQNQITNREIKSPYQITMKLTEV